MRISSISLALVVASKLSCRINRYVRKSEFCAEIASQGACIGTALWEVLQVRVHDMIYNRCL